MEVTHFIIDELPDAAFVTSSIGSDQLFKDTLYPIARESEMAFNRINPLEGYYHSTSIRYRVYDEVSGKYSNPVTSTLKWEEIDLSVLPESMSNTLLMEKSEENTLLELLPINETVEFIRIINITGATQLNNRNKYNVGDDLSPALLHKNKYITNPAGGGFPYYELTYKIGRDGVLEDQEYKMTINVESFAEIEILSQNSTQDGFEMEDGSIENEVVKFFNVVVKEGYQNGTAQLEFNINSPFLDAHPDNELQIEINEEEHIFTENGVHNLEANLNNSGAHTIKVRAVMESDAVVNVDVNLLSINNDPQLVVQESNSVTLNQ